WHVTDLRSESSPVTRSATSGDSRGIYALTLVLKETQGVPLTCTYRKDTIYASNITVFRPVDQAINFNSILKFFQVDNAGMLRMPSSARYFKEVVGPSRPS